MLNDNKNYNLSIFNKAAATATTTQTTAAPATIIPAIQTRVGGGIFKIVFEKNDCVLRDGCPFQFPRCLTFTQGDCQHCVCEVGTSSLPPPPGYSLNTTSIKKAIENHECSGEMKTKLNIYMQWLYNKIFSQHSQATFAYPAAVRLSKAALTETLCPAFHEAVGFVGKDIWNLCKYENSRLVVVNSNLGAICDPANQNLFFT